MYTLASVSDSEVRSSISIKEHGKIELAHKIRRTHCEEVSAVPRKSRTTRVALIVKKIV